MARGTDVHPYYQRGLNWKAAPDIHYAWVKVSDGGSAYSTTQGGIRYVPDTHVAGAKAAGIPVGGYHYAQFGSPEAQADVLIREVRRLGATGLTPMLDLEAPFTPDATARDFGVRFCTRLATAFRPAVYMNNAFAKALRPDLWGIPGLVIVIARYGAHPDASAGRYDVHQYSSSGTLPGSAGLVDLDESYTNNHLTAQGDDMLRDERDALFAILNALVTPHPSKVAGSTATYSTEEFVRFNNANLFNLTTKTLPAIQDGLTQLGADLSAFEAADVARDNQLGAAIAAIQGGDVHALADALIPLLPKSATPDDVATAIRAAFARASA